MPALQFPGLLGGERNLSRRSRAKREPSPGGRRAARSDAAAGGHIVAFGALIELSLGIDLHL
jgi:hypothetical protein